MVVAVGETVLDVMFVTSVPFMVTEVAPLVIQDRVVLFPVMIVTGLAAKFVIVGAGIGVGGTGVTVRVRDLNVLPTPFDAVSV